MTVVFPSGYTESMMEAEFDRALGAWEDGQLNRYLAEGAAWEEAYDDLPKEVRDD